MRSATATCGRGHLIACIDPTAFTVADLYPITAGAYAYGNAGRNILRGPAAQSVNFSVAKNFPNVLAKPSYATAAMLAGEVIDGYLAEEFDQVILLFNAFRTVMSQDITFQQLLPVVPEEKTAADEAPVEYIYEPSVAELLAEILPKNIEVQIFKAMLESVAAEHGARMTAMDSASKNANEMIGKLTLQYNRARQAAITTELMEIISGAESIKG